MEVAEYLTAITVTYQIEQNPGKSSSFNLKPKRQPDTTTYHLKDNHTTSEVLGKKSNLNMVMLEF